MTIPLAVIGRLILVINCLVNEYLPPLEHVINDGHLNYNALRHVETILTQTRRDDVLQILHQTMAGDINLLERHERNIHRILDLFYNDRDHASHERPTRRYRFTQNNNPLRQETSGHRGRTENGNIVVSDTEGATQNNERYRDVEARYRDQDLSHPSAPRPRDPQTGRPQADQRKPPLPVLDDRAFRSLQLPSQEAVFPQPSTPLGNPPREEPRQPPRCYICGKNMQFRMPIPLAVIGRLILVINCLVNEYLPPLEHVINDGHLNYNALRHVEIILTQTRRDDVLQILHQTMAGNINLLERHERNIHRILHQFYNDRDHASHEWPAWCYRVTQNNNPLRQETSGHRGRTENGNIVVSDTEGATQNNERYRDVEARSRDQDLSHPSAPRPRDPQTSRPQADQRKPPLPVLDDRAFRSLQLPSQEAVFPQPSTPLGNPPREEPREPLRCCICGKNMQDMKTSRPVWSRISEIIKELNLHQLQAFITEINNCDARILNSIQFHAIPSHEIVDALVWPLQRCHLSGQKCVLCLLNYVFQRIGRSDLANQVKGIQYRLG